MTNYEAESRLANSITALVNSPDEDIYAAILQDAFGRKY